MPAAARRGWDTGRYELGGRALGKLRVGQHLAFLAEREDGLLVVRILHVRQDIEHELE